MGGEKVANAQPSLQRLQENAKPPRSADDPQTPTRGHPVTETEFQTAIRRLVAVTRHTPGTQMIIELRRVLTHYPAHEVEHAIDQHIEQSRYFPDPSELVKLLGHPHPPTTQQDDCPHCGGTGWRDTTPPPGSTSNHEPWVERCPHPATIHTHA